MKEENIEKLFKDFPVLYRFRESNFTLLRFDFPQDGWYDIIYRLSEKLEGLVEKWNGEEELKPYVCQIKEKYAQLRYYMSGNTTDEMNDLITEAEKEASKTCEQCSSTENVKSDTIQIDGHWLTTLCEDCFSEKRKKQV